ncbi:hypothetical protein V7161_10655 [Neobacillus drentensis]|uniref:hypothetical protein n=1 Tax=Neobacillus drentensis TaxID=220684 RepID=UPI002FFF7529
MEKMKIANVPTKVDKVDFFNKHLNKSVLSSAMTRREWEHQKTKLENWNIY